VFLWHAHRLETPQRVLAAAGIVAGLWRVGRLRGRERGHGTPRVVG
jgi:hypothetical protein